MNENLETSEIRLIIRNLISFIAVEGKEYVQDSKKSNYVEAYIHMLVKIMNLIDEGKDQALVEHIAEDISRHLK